jgi:hypothetical protein
MNCVHCSPLRPRLAGRDCTSEKPPGRKPQGAEPKRSVTCIISFRYTPFHRYSACIPWKQSTLQVQLPSEDTSRLFFLVRPAKSKTNFTHLAHCHLHLRTVMVAMREVNAPPHQVKELPCQALSPVSARQQHAHTSVSDLAPLHPVSHAVDQRSS